MSKTELRMDTYWPEDTVTALEHYAGGWAGNEIDKVLHNEGGKLINDAIMQLLPYSGRTWAGKKPSASKTQPFEQKNDSLSVTIRTKYAYHYLYFPDDGTNTRRHVGYKGNPREFMMKGAESVTDIIIDKCVKKLTEILGE